MRCSRCSGWWRGLPGTLAPLAIFCSCYRNCTLLACRAVVREHVYASMSQGKELLPGCLPVVIPVGNAMHSSD
jgi:hypothetical protein